MHAVTGIAKGELVFPAHSRRQSASYGPVSRALCTIALRDEAFDDVHAVAGPDVVPLMLPVGDFAVVLATVDPAVVPLMLPVEVAADVLADADPDVVRVMLAP